MKHHFTFCQLTMMALFAYKMNLFIRKDEIERIFQSLNSDQKAFGLWCAK